MKKRVAVLLVLASLTTICAGCWDLRPVEDLSMLYSIAIDMAPNGQDLLVTGSRPVFADPSDVDKRQLWAEARDITHAFTLMQAQENSVVMVGKIILYVFGEDVWRSGRLIELARQLYVRPDISLTGLIVCVKGKANEILMLTPPELKLITINIFQSLVASTARGIVPSSPLIQVARHAELQKDLWIPLIEKAAELDRFLIAGSVAFCESRPGAVLSLSETAELIALSGTGTRYTFEVPDPETNRIIGVMIKEGNLRSRAEEKPDGGLRIDASTSCSVTICTPVDLKGDVGSRLGAMRKVIARDFEARGQRLLAKLQQADSDPLGLVAPGLFTGDAEARHRREAYKTAQITYRVDSRITELTAE